MDNRSGLRKGFRTHVVAGIARRDLVLEAAIAKLDKYHLLILDDLAYVTKDQAETSVSRIKP